MSSASDSLPSMAIFPIWRTWFVHARSVASHGNNPRVRSVTNRRDIFLGPRKGTRSVVHRTLVSAGDAGVR